MRDASFRCATASQKCILSTTYELSNEDIEVLIRFPSTKVCPEEICFDIRGTTLTFSTTSVHLTITPSQGEPQYITDLPNIKQKVDAVINGIPAHPSTPGSPRPSCEDMFPCDP